MEKVKMKKTTVALLISFGVLVLISLLNWGVVTGWGNVRITNVTIAGDDGLEYTALLYTPKSASNVDKAPAYLCLHGYSGNARNHESWAVEYARRGFVVLSIDNYGSGDSEFADNLSTAAKAAAEAAANGTQKQGGAMGNSANTLIPVAFAKYLAGLPYVDAENIVIGGHSMGAQATTAAAAVVEAKVLVLCEPMGANAKNVIGSPSVIWEWGTADKLRTEEKDLETAYNFFKARGANVSEGETVVETGKVYTNASGAKFQHVFINKMIHEAAFVNSTAIGTQVAFVQEVLGDAVPNPIPANNLIWFWKDWTGLAGVFAFVVFVCALLCFLMEEVPFFGSVKQELPRNIGLRGFGFWLSVGVGVVVPFITTYFANLGLNGLFGAKSAYSNVEKGIFRLRFTNISLAVVIALTIIGGLMLILYIFTDGKKHKAKLEDFGLTTTGNSKISWALIGKSALLALTILFISYT